MSFRACILLLGFVVSSSYVSGLGAGRAGQLGDGLYAEIVTSKGTIVARLEAELTPMTVANFVGLAEGTIANEAFGPGVPYYDGSVFHRVVPGHVIQAGRPDPQRSEAGGPGHSFPNEIHADLSHDHAGALGMANGGPHTNSAQFYVTLGDRSYLDGDYIVFGEVVEGMGVVESIVQDDAIERMRILRIGAAAQAYRVDTESFERLVDGARARIDNDAVDRRRLEREYVELTFPGARSVSSSGLQYIVQQPGSGEPPAAGETISVRYVGTALKYRGHLLGVRGPLFDPIRFAGAADGSPQSEDLAPDLFDYTLGSTRLTPALDEAFAALRPGEQRIVIAPAETAYGRVGYYGPNVPGRPRLVVSPYTMVVYGVERAAR